ncbi:uncharacterized protein LOC125877274 [Solanum stenotomum]|uniref:uncharacterized protein LOC125877274 n=1 Tax=Solanum stenotomum TaxID=172797 RepID=UPI0020D18DA3|nr:uncharacterized protein LOC125877274 [Solanum stenotomum]
MGQYGRHNQNKHLGWLRRFLKAKKYYEEVGWNEEEILRWPIFSVKKMYIRMRGEFPKVEWRRFICNNAAPPRWTFILYLALNERLQTRERLAAWGIVDDLRCVLCSSGMDSSEHLFFVCKYSATLWRKILQWMHIDRQVLGWKEKITWALRHFKGKHALVEIFRMALAASIYAVWQERNNRIIQNKLRPVGVLIRKIVHEFTLEEGGRQN